MSRQLKLRALVLGAVLSLVASTTAFAAVSTDAYYYNLGDTVQINGDGMQAGETVVVDVNYPDGSLAQEHQVMADELGNFADSFYLDVNMPGGVYEVIASGQTSSAVYTTTFDPANLSLFGTDGNQHVLGGPGSPLANEQNLGSVTQGTALALSGTTCGQTPGTYDMLEVRITGLNGGTGGPHPQPADTLNWSLDYDGTASDNSTLAPLTTGFPASANETGNGNPITHCISMTIATATLTIGTTYHGRLRLARTGGTATATDTTYLFRFNVTAPAPPPNSAPVIDSLGTFSGNEGSSINLSATAHDPDGDPLTYSWAIDTTGGDTGISCPITDATNADAAASLNCNDDSNGGTFKVTLNVSDNHAHTTSQDTTVAVANLAPVVTFDSGDDQSVNESSSLEHTYNYTVSDPGSNDVVTPGSTTCGTYGAKVLLSDGPGTFKCVFDDGGATPPGTNTNVGASAIDDEGLTGTGTQAVNISNVPPTITSVTPNITNAFIGQNVTFTGTATDPSGADTTAGFSWKFDGGAYGAVGANTITTLFDTCGVHTVSAVAKDKDGGESAAVTSTSVNVYQYTVKFLQPFDGSSPSNLITNTMKSGRVVPVKITIYDDCNATYVNDPSALVKIFVKDTGAASTSNDAIETYADAGASNSNTLYFRWSADSTVVGGGFWIYNLDSRTALNGSPFTVNSTYRIDAYVGSLKATVDTWALLKAVK